MDKTVIVSALAGLSVLTTLTVEGIKKILNSKGVKYNADVLAAITAVILTVLSAIGYVIYNNIPVNAQVIVSIVAMCFFSFLGATVGFGKLIRGVFQKDLQK